MAQYANPATLNRLRETDTILDRLQGVAAKALQNQLGELTADLEAEMDRPVAEDRLPALVAAFVRAPFLLSSRPH